MLPGIARPIPSPWAGLFRMVATLDRMDYVAALTPPVVMAAFFIALVRVIVKTQGGANKTKEDAAVDAAFAQDAAPRTAGAASSGSDA